MLCPGPGSQAQVPATLTIEETLDKFKLVKLRPHHTGTPRHVQLVHNVAHTYVGKKAVYNLFLVFILTI